MQPPSLPGLANQNHKWDVFVRIFGNQGRCLSSEMLAGTLRKLLSPGIHVPSVSPITHLFICCFFQFIVP
jgi:hypothetical protein